MATSLLQLTLAITPAIIASMVIKRIRMPWEKQKTPSERAELLNMLAKDIKSVKTIMASNIAAVNAGRACALPSLPLTNWKRLKRDSRLSKYTDEKIFKTMIRQFRDWERMGRTI
jgi:hypothetical protein|tara:strand:- start:545 stop:889 length:345 start_codon:yes stop_codon:yes gene_type:complete